jgi:hypothetical protein
MMGGPIMSFLNPDGWAETEFSHWSHFSILMDWQILTKVTIVRWVDSNMSQY